MNQVPNGLAPPCLGVRTPWACEDSSRLKDIRTKRLRPSIPYPTKILRSYMDHKPFVRHLVCKAHRAACKARRLRASVDDVNTTSSKDFGASSSLEKWVPTDHMSIRAACFENCRAPYSLCTWGSTGLYQSMILLIPCIASKACLPKR